MKSFYTYAGTEFNHLRKTVEVQGVETDDPTAYTPASNYLAERHVGLVLQSTRAVLPQAQLPMTYLDFAVRHVA